jgi:predicted ABC-type transport system involved in lysophospholipase L1 biosynthesis ATPase subunit
VLETITQKLVTKIVSIGLLSAKSPKINFIANSNTKQVNLLSLDTGLSQSSSQSSYSVLSTECNELDEKKQETLTKNQIDTLFQNFSNKLYSKISQLFTIKSNNKDTIRNVAGFVVNIEHIGVYLNIIPYFIK